MLEKDHDRILQLWVFYQFLDEWVKDPDTEFKLDTKKVSIIRENVRLIIRSIGKQQGKLSVDAILEECEKYIFGFLPKEKAKNLINTCEYGILKNAINKVIEKDTQCEMCNRCDYKYCEMFTIKKFLNKEEKKTKKGCPFRKSLDDIFDVGEL